MKFPVKFILAVTAATLILVAGGRTRTVEIAFDPSVSDYTPVVREVLEKYPKGNIVLKFTEGTYPFYPEEARSRYLTVSNNDNGLKKVIFSLDGMKNVSIEGDSSEFLFHGAVIPFAVTDCSNVRISGISIDYDAPFTLEGTVLAKDEAKRTFTLKIHPDNEYEILDERFYFLGYDWKARLGENIVYDPATKSPYYNTAAYQHWPLHQFSATEVASGIVTFGNVYMKDLPPVGSVWVDKGEHPGSRYCSAIVLSDSENLLIENVHVYRSGAMSLIAQYCEDITVRGFSTAQKKGRDRMVTSSADATHFVDCKGDILIENCCFESMLDDAVNIHGIYMPVRKFLSDDSFAVSFGHYQQQGNRFADKGDVLRIIDRTTMRPVGTGKLLSVDRVSENWYVLRTDFPLETLSDPERYAVENISRGASAVIRNCTVRYNRARSLLLSTPKPVLVENCSFASMMAGIVICGDANFWYESGSTSEIVIRGNTFKDLGKGGNSPQAVLQIDPMIGPAGRTNDSFYHGTVIFEDNIVETFDNQLIYALSVENLIIRNNVFADSGTWAPLYDSLAAIDAVNCGKVTVTGNDFTAWKKDAEISLHDCVDADIDAPELKANSNIPRAEGSESLNSALAAYVAEAAEKNIDIKSIIIVQGGNVKGEAYLNGATADDPHRMWSTSKSFTSFAVGYAIEEGLLSLDDKMSDIFPEEVRAVADTLSDPVLKANLLNANIRDYLVMGCGQKSDPTFILGAEYSALTGLNDIDSLDSVLKRLDRNLITDFFTVPFEAEPGTYNCYNSIGSYMLSAAVQKVTGQKISDWLQPRLFEPLGIEKPRWDEVQGINCGGWGLWLKPEEMAKVGLCMLNGGRYNGKQVLPEAWLQEASRSFFTWDLPTGKTSEEYWYHATGYGYQIWQNPDSFFTAGMYGQFIYVFPELDAVVTCTADVLDDDSKESALVWKHIVPVLKAEAHQKCAAADSQAASEESRWRIGGLHDIVWEVSGEDWGHHDHIEMSGERISVIYEYGVNEAGEFDMKRNVIWPLLRKYPNDTYGHTSMQFSQNFLEGITVGGKPLSEGKVRKVSLDGKLSAVTDHAPLEISRTLFPSTTKAAVCEEYILRNTSDSPLTVTVPEQRYEFLTDEKTGVDGAYRLIARTSHTEDLTLTLNPSESAVFYAAVQGYKYPEIEEYIDVPYEKQLRDAFVEQVCGNLILDTPDPVLNTMFAFAKIRGSESLFRTKGGLTHSPGGGYYYSAIWANDQAEYICPFFPFLGYEKGNEAAMNAFLHFAEFMNPDYQPLPSSVIAEFTDIWNGCGDRGDAAMIAYGAGRYALALGDRAAAQRLWPLINWCLEYCRRQLTPEGVVASDTDELENRFESGDANLCTSSLYYDALRSAAILAESFGEENDFTQRAEAMKSAIGSFFGAEVRGYDTYRYYEGNDVLRSWICIPLTMGIYDRKDGTTAALLSDRLWTDNGILTEEGSSVFWDRATLYALRGIFAAGRTEEALSHLQQYSSRRLLGDHVPYAIEAWPENDQRHLSAESGLYCRVYTEGLFGFRPEGFRRFSLTPHLPSGWDSMSLHNVHACSSEPYDIEVIRISDSSLKVLIFNDSGLVRTENADNGQTIIIDL